MIKITGATRAPAPKQAAPVAPLRPMRAKPAMKTEVPWQECAFQTLQAASRIAGVSVASLYRFEGEGRLTFRRLAGRTLVETASLTELLQSAETWTPSDAGGAARTKRAEAARASWHEHAA
jgi:hypothetical protein